VGFKYSISLDFARMSVASGRRGAPVVGAPVGWRRCVAGARRVFKLDFPMATVTFERSPGSFGVGAGDVHTIEEVADAYGLT